MDYSAQYQKKLTTPDEAVRCIRSGDWLDYSWCACTPDLLDQALARRLPELTDLKIRGGTCLRDPAIFQVPDGAEHFCFNSWHMTGFERRRMASGMVYYNPLRYSELPRYYREHTERVDVAMVMAAPMDEEGYFNFGPNATHMEALMKKADRILVEVNPHMIRCCGAGNRVHIDRVTAIVEGGRAMAGLPVPEATEVERQIAARIVPLIPDGATLQLGIGGLPNVVGEQLADSDLKDLGVHTEMYVDAYLALARAGKITGANKAIDRGLQIYAFGAGSQALYDYLDNNPEVQVRPVDYTNDVRVIAQIDKFISINSAVDVDLTGQVNAESAGHRHISGAGGQLDFVLGAYLSNGGKSIIACSSTFTDKTGAVHSRIRPTLTPGSAVTDTRTNLHWFVTEYGAVCLKGQATWQRAELLISVAHPDLRDQLIKEADALGFWRRSNKR